MPTLLKLWGMRLRGSYVDTGYGELYWAFFMHGTTVILCTILNAETNGTRGTRAEDNSNAASQSTPLPSSTSAGEKGSEGGVGGGEDFLVVLLLLQV